MPLCLDLDGTLLNGDLAIESTLLLLRRNPLYLFPMLAWLLRGRAYCKQEIARRVRLDVAGLPYDERLLAWARSQAGKRPCLLVTASDRRLADQVADHLGCIDEVMASDGRENLSGARKADRLVERFGLHGFDYAGNAAVDLQVWKKARAAIVANAGAGLVARARQISTVEAVYPAEHGGPARWMSALRLHQWVKNLLVFLPLLGAHLLSDGHRLALGGLAWLAFGLCASATYLINDLLDLQADRKHPHKRRRALASGRLWPQHAMLAVPALLAAAFGLSGWLLPATFTAMLAFYLVVTLAYSLLIKRLRWLDVLTLACLFVLRVLAGGAATDVRVSPWLLALSLLAFLSLALMKRFTELLGLDARQLAMVEGRGYGTHNLAGVLGTGIAAAIAGVLVLCAYIASPASRQLYSQPDILWLLCPLFLAWMARAWHLARRGDMHDDPIIFATRDLTSWLTAIAVAAIVWAAI